MNLCFQHPFHDSLPIDKSNWTKLSDKKDNCNNNANGKIITAPKRKIYYKFTTNKNDRNLKENIFSVCSNMFSPWEPKLLMDGFILWDYHQDYYIIKHINQDCLFTIYYDPQKYLVSNRFQVDVFSLLCKNLATSAIN